MTLTLEARWFVDSPLPYALREWLDTLNPEEPSHWTDLYLPAKGPSLNLKLRNEKIQVKHRLGASFQQSLGPKVTAHCEQWVKWSFPCTDESPPLWDTDPTGLWVAVEKTRRRRRVAPADQSALSEALPTSPPAAIEVEITKVRVKNEMAWTFCLEAEGPVQSLEDTLTATGEALFMEDFPVTLPVDHSFGYVHWLNEVLPEGERPASEVRISPE